MAGRDGNVLEKILVPRDIRCWKINFILCADVQHTVQLEHVIHFLNMQMIIHLNTIMSSVDIKTVQSIATYTYQALKLHWLKSRICKYVSI